MSQERERTELYARVRGDVQGVGFRQFVVRRALSLGLRGYARNVSDGSVEVLAQGERKALERLLGLLHQGPPAASVTQISSEWRAPTEYFSGFHVRW